MSISCFRLWARASSQYAVMNATEDICKLGDAAMKLVEMVTYGINIFLVDSELATQCGVALLLSLLLPSHRLNSKFPPFKGETCQVP